MANIKIDNLSQAIADELSKYSQEITDSIKEIVTDEANKLAESISEDSPKRSKKIKGRAMNRYSKGWTVKRVFENKYNVSYEVHNKSDYQLTHLLEKGFATRDGGRVEGREHIKPNEEKMIEQVDKRIKETIGG